MNATNEAQSLTNEVLAMSSEEKVELLLNRMNLLEHRVGNIEKEHLALINGLSNLEKTIKGRFDKTDKKITETQSTISSLENKIEEELNNFQENIRKWLYDVLPNQIKTNMEQKIKEHSESCPALTEKK